MFKGIKEYKHFDLVLEGVSSMHAVLKITDASCHLLGSLYWLSVWSHVSSMMYTSKQHTSIIIVSSAGT